MAVTIQNRNVYKKKSSGKWLDLLLFILFAVVDCILVLKYSSFRLAEPKTNYVILIEKVLDSISNKTILHIALTKPLINMFILTQQKLLILYVLILMIILANMLKPRSDFKGIEYGSADWEKDRTRFKNSKNTIPLADKLYLDPKDNEADNLNELVIGGSGAGKSFRKMQAELMQLTGSFVATDPKGELYRHCSKMLRKNGYKVRVLNILEPRYSNGYNPFTYINKDKIDNDVLVLVNVFMKNTKDPNQKGEGQFWDDSMKAILSAICYYLVLEEGENKTFERVFELVRGIKVDEETGDIDPECELPKIFKNLERTQPWHPALIAYQEFILASGKTAKDILISMAVRMNIWISQDVCAMTYQDEMNLSKIGTEKTAIFLIVPDTDDTFNVLASMFYTQLFKSICYEADYNNNGRLPIMVSVLCDEFPNIGEIPNFHKYIATVRSRNARIVPVVQGISQLKGLYKDTWKAILTCCYVINYLGTTDEDSQKYVSDKMGKCTVYVETRGNSKSSKSASHDEHGNYVGRELMTTAELDLLPKLKSIVLMGRLHPFYCDKFKTEKHPKIKECGSDFILSRNNTNIAKEFEKISQERREQVMERRKRKFNIKEENEEIVKKYNAMSDKSRDNEIAMDDESKKDFENHDFSN